MAAIGSVVVNAAESAVVSADAAELLWQAAFGQEIPLEQLCRKLSDTFPA